MTGGIRVIEDGADRRIRVRPPTPPWVWILVGLAVTVGLIVVFATPSTSVPIPEAVVVTSTFADSISSPALPFGVGDAVPGFPDALVAVTLTDSQTLQHLLWPIAGDPVRLTLPVGALGESKFDVGGTWLAVSSGVPDTGDNLLSMGKPASLQPLAADVTSFAWHDSNSALLAYTQSTDTGWELLISESGRAPQIIATDIENIGEVAAWGDWGWAIQGESGFITLLNSDGELKTTAQGKVLDSDPGGRILIFDEQVKLLSTGGGLRTVDVDPSSIGGVLGGAIAPDGKSVALIGSIGLNVTAIAGDAPELGVPFPASVSKVNWSSDSRFVVIPFLRGVIIVDVVTGETYEELREHTVVESSVISLTR